jgi:hypothetical protein
MPKQRVGYYINSLEENEKEIDTMTTPCPVPVGNLNMMNLSEKSRVIPFTELFGMFVSNSSCS